MQTRYMPRYSCFVITSVLLVSSIPAFADLPAPHTLESASATKPIDVRIYETPSSKIDPAIYGAKPLTIRPDFETAETTYVAPKEVPIAEAFKGSPLLAEGKAKLEENRREKATMMESAGAAFSHSLPSKAVDNVPQFNWENGYSPIPLLEQVDLPLTLEQERSLIETKSSAEFQYKLQKLREESMAREAMRDNPITSRITTAFASGYVLFGLVLIIGAWTIFKTRIRSFNKSLKDKKIIYLRWGLRLTILVAAFAIHWAFGLFMCLGLYTYLTSARR